MIARIWTAHAAPGTVPAYAEHLRAHVLLVLREVEGYAGAALLRRSANDTVELVVVTWWASLEAITRFAGPDPERAVVTTEAAALLTAYDGRVRHYEVVAEDAGFDRSPEPRAPR